MILDNTPHKPTLNRLRERFQTIALASLVSFTMTQCNVAGLNIGDDSADDSSSSSSSSSSSTGSVSGTQGTLKSADGAPLAGASVALTTSSNSSTQALARSGGRGVLGLTNDNGQFVPLFQSTDNEGETCDDITDGLTGTVIATDCTNAEGVYTLSAEDIPCGEELTFTAKKGSFTLSVAITLACEDEDEEEVVAIDDIEFDDDCGIVDESDSDELALTSAPRYTMADDSCAFDSARMAVVTGYYDEIQNVLAKLGFGSVDDYGRLDMSAPFDFTMIDGSGSLDESFEEFEDFVSNADNLSEYDIIFINCGNSAELLAQDDAIKANLQEYVEEGGKLYVTDWSYGFIEQPFPSFMDFLDGGDDAETPETHAAAKQGTGGITVDADVQDDTLASWLDAVTVNDGTIEADCYLADESLVNGRDGARNDDGTVTIADFLGSWVVMTDEHAEYAGENQMWLSGVISAYPGVADAPLTVTRDHGEGRLLYSSYHTAHSCPTQGFWPQERVLQYLVFEL